MAYLKLVDMAVQNPQTGKYKLDSHCDGEDTKYLPQGRKWCFSVKVVMGKESAQMYQDKFQKIVDTFTKASEEGQDICP